MLSQEIKNERAKKYYYDNRDKVLQRVSKYQKLYRNTDKGMKVMRVSQWERRGINCDDEWDEVYEWWMSATHCDICGDEFTKGNKCLDHDHHLEGYNVRGILCRSCNNILREL